MKKSGLNENQRKIAKKTIVELLENKEMTRSNIVKKLKQDFNLENATIRSIIREVRTDFLQKLAVLQSGVINI